MRRIILLIPIIALFFFSTAQNTVQYDIEPVIENIQNDFVKVWNRVGETNGFRIQIAAVTGANSKSTAENERLSFQSRFPEIPAYLSYMEPYFRIRVGNFFTRLEAYKTLQEIILVYPNAYIIPDKINFLE